MPFSRYLTLFKYQDYYFLHELFIGYAHYCIGNYREAVRYYDQDLALAKDLQDKMNMGRAYCNLGLAHLALNQLDTSLECQKYFLAIAHMTNNTAGIIHKMFYTTFDNYSK